MRLSLWPAILGLALAMIVVTIVNPVPSSLSYASGILVLIALVGWVMEARQIAGPPPEVEPEHEEEEEAPGPSYWPVVLSIGIVGIASGLIYDYDWGGLIIAVPLALAAAAAWGSHIQHDFAEVEAEKAAGIPLRGPGGRTLLPVPAQTLAAQAAGGAAIAIERVETGTVSRRSLLRVTFWTGIVGFLGALAASTIDMLYPRGITGFGSVISAGTVEEFPPGTKTDISEGKFWLVHLTEEQAKASDPVNGKAGFLALWWKCPHLGCTVPWRPTFSFLGRQGWFRCPCHGSTYDDAGQRVFGPAPRSMDRMEITIAGGRISVNTGAVTKGTPDNAAFSVEA
jgi:cytochrome b6-f complex iron-sulfur subunit